MKKYLIILSCILFGQNLMAQVPDYFGNNPTWIDNYGDPTGDLAYYDKHIYYLDGTETIGSYTYHLMRYRNYRSGNEWGPFEYQDDYASLKVRQEGRKIFFYDTITEEDSLLISYELEVGDELIGQPGYFFPTSVITEIDSILIDDEYRRVLHFDGGEPNARYIEGISYQWGELDNNYGSCFAQMYIVDYEPSFAIYGFNCFGEEGISLWKPLPELSCDFTLKLDENKLRDQSFVVYPNPATDEISVQMNQTEIDKIEIHSLLGQVLGTYSVQTNAIQTIDISAIPKGIYILQLCKNGIVNAQEKFVKE